MTVEQPNFQKFKTSSARNPTSEVPLTSKRPLSVKSYTVEKATKFDTKEYKEDLHDR